MQQFTFNDGSRMITMILGEHKDFTFAVPVQKNGNVTDQLTEEVNDQDSAVSVFQAT